MHRIAQSRQAAGRGGPGAAIGGGTTMLTHCDFVYAGESAKFQMPFINLAVVPEFGSSCSDAGADRSSPRRGADFIGSALRCQARRGARSGDRGRIRQGCLGEGDRNGREIGGEAGAALQASKRLMKQPFREQIKAAMKAENEEFSVQVRSDDAKEAFKAFLEKRKPDFTRSGKTTA